MKRVVMMGAVLLAVLAFSVSVLSCFPAVPPGEPGEIRLDARLNTPVISSNGGTVYLQLTVTAPEGTVRHVRQPMNLAVVLDRSGSMGDEHKLDYAKKALLSLIDQLHEEDIFSLVIYDDVV